MNAIEKFFLRNIKPKFNTVINYNNNPKNILDIGIANKSYIETKSLFPNAIYTGVDFEDLSFAIDKSDFFFKKNLEEVTSLDFLNTDKYDLILANHVLEHLCNGAVVYELLCRKLAKGGMLYAEFPSIETIKKKKNKYNYHFHDDPTHKRLYCIETLANIAMANGLKIMSCGPAGTALKNVLSIPRACYAFLKGDPPGPQLLFLQKKITYIAVTRPK